MPDLGLSKDRPWYRRWKLLLGFLLAALLALGSFDASNAWITRKRGHHSIFMSDVPFSTLRGAVLLLAAQRLTKGRAVGVDLWRRVDQSGNSLEATRRNAIAEGVDDRVELHTANLMALPFEDDSFDLVVSNLAIHNISGRAGREKAISEGVRVLRPGGRLLIVDVRGTRHHHAQLARMGMTQVARRWLGWRLMVPLVTATKPQRRS